jgi:small GTP-binding protein
MNYDEKCQLIIIGDSTVGKTSLLFRYTENKFSSQHFATVGIDFFTKDESFNGKVVRIKVWDTAGQERYKSLTGSFFKNAQGIILVYDVNNLESFENLKYWLQSINLNLGDQNNIKKIIIGNKIDLSREVKKEDAEKFAVTNSAHYFETSALENKGILEAMRFVVEEILKEKLNPNKSKDTIRLTTTSNGDQSSSHSQCKC